MAWFRRNSEPEARIASLAELQTIMDRSGRTVSGVVVDPDKAMRLSAVWSSVELIAGVGSSLPLDEYRKQGDGQQIVPLSTVFADPDPDPSVSAVGFRAQILRSAATRGNAYAFVIGGESGVPTGLQSIHPDRVTWEWDRKAGTWQLYVDRKKHSIWPLGDVWHFALFQEPGCPIGLSPVEYHKQAIGAAIAAQRFGQQFFDGGGNPSMIIKPPQRLSEDDAKALKQKVTDVTRGNREPLVMPQEIQIERLSISPDDSQFLETQRYGVEEIARVFLGGFPELIGGSVAGGSVTYANREQRMADFLALSLAPRYLVPLEAALSTLVPPGRYVKHNVNALLRSDLAARYASYKTSAEVSKIMGTPLQTINEMRALEDMAPIAGGDEMAPAVEPPATKVQIVDPNADQVRAAEPVEVRTWDPPSPAEVHVHNHFPEQRHDVTIPVTVDAPVVNITHEAPEQRDVVVPAPMVTVNVEPTPVTNVVNVEPTPVQVDARTTVEAPGVEVNPNIVVQVPEDKPSRKTVKYDSRGRVAEIVEEEI